jgi:hypothetical protein
MKVYSKYPKRLIGSIAEETGMGMVCFLNPDTLEIESVPGMSYGSYEFGDLDECYQEVYKKVNHWKNCVRIEPPEAGTSFKIMERFIQDCIPDSDNIKGHLWKAISGRKPFMKFKLLIEKSCYRQAWFDFKQAQLELFVADLLDDPDISV